MSNFPQNLFPKRAAVIIGLSLALTGCSSFDHLQRSDKVSHSAGNAVKANLIMSTVNPSKKSMNSTSGLGKNGAVIPAAEE